MLREKTLNIIVLAIIFIIAFVTYFLDQGYYLNLVSRVVIFAIAGVGLNLALGYGGMVSLGHAAFFGVGGYIAGISAQNFSEGSEFIAGLSSSNQMLTIWLVVILVCALLALFIGLISLRTTGVYFIMITLAFAQMVYYFAISWPDYGGEDGLLITTRNQFMGQDTDNELGLLLD